ncbi:T9SS type A sorting domain-containing protein [Kordia sp.]|uniref:T9SS type A sorting domain-containing protein n=1 Tax=Kordia sp. TaxID=1965332 RepID=UPI003D6A0240
MKKTLFFIALLFCSFAVKAQSIHQLPTSPVDIAFKYTFHTNPAQFNDTTIVDAIDDILQIHLANADQNLLNNPLTTNEYLTKRVLSHILLYYYFDNQGEFSERDTHLVHFQTYFQHLLDAQCISYNTQNICANSNGGFHLDIDDPVSTRITSLALEAFLEAKKFFKIACGAVLPISETEFEDRIQQATNIILNDPKHNNRYFNGVASAFTALSKHYEIYRDAASQNFLLTKGDELINELHPLRSDTNTSTVWIYHEVWDNNYDWNEGMQVDGSWKDFGEDWSIDSGLPGREYNDFERWHDSESAYHSTMIEGLAYLYKNVSDTSLKTNTREKLIASINHIIDYNGKTLGLEHNNFENFIVGNGSYSQTRLSSGGRIANHHRETIASEYPAGEIKQTVTGTTLLRSLITAENVLKSYFSTDQASIDRLDLIIRGVAFGITNNLGNNSYQQLYDLAAFLNRDAINGNFPGTQYTKDKLVVAFDNKLISAFHQDDIPTGDKLARVDNFYIHNQQTYQMTSGDFDNNGNKEAIIAFEYGNIYRYTENNTGRFAAKELIYNDGALTLALETGNFNDNDKDELIIALDNGEIRRYERDDSVSAMVLTETFFTDPFQTVNQMQTVDFDGDGKDELIIAFNDGSIEKYADDGSGNLVQVSNSIFYSTNSAVIDMAAGDFNNNGAEELIISFDIKYVLRYFEDNTTTVTNTNQTVYSGANTALSIAAGDFDGNEEDELIIAFDNDEVKRYRIDNTTNTLTTTTNDIVYNGSQLVKTMAVGNFNGDTKEELIISFEFGNIYRYFLNNAGNLQIKEGIYYCGNLTNTMIVLDKSSTANRASTGNVGLFESTVQSDIKIYPNPANDILNISGLTAKADYSIHSLEGKLIAQGTIKEDGRIDVSQFSKGFYILKVENNVFKILKN